MVFLQRTWHEAARLTAASVLLCDQQMSSTIEQLTKGNPHLVPPRERRRLAGPTPHVGVLFRPDSQFSLADSQHGHIAASGSDDVASVNGLDIHRIGPRRCVNPT